MLHKLIQYFLFLREIRIIQFFYLNYFSKKVVRKGKGKIIPYKHSVIELEKGTKVYLDDGDIEIGCNRLKKSKIETLVRMRENSIWRQSEGCKISYGCTIDILQNVEFRSEYFTMNCNSVIVAACKIHFGHDVMIGRNVVIYDSDFHQILDTDGQIANYSREVSIGNHVWIGVNVTILKGTVIEDGCIIGANASVSGHIENNTMYWNKRECCKQKDFARWDRSFPES